MTKKEDYSRIHDEEADRTRVELWIIVAVVVVVLVGALAWRVIAHKPAQPANSIPAGKNLAGTGVPAAAAGVQAPHLPPATPQ
jgi:predicted acyltransferase